MLTKFVKTNHGWDVYSLVTNVNAGATFVRESFEKVGAIRKTKVPGDNSLVFVVEPSFDNWELGPITMSAIVSHILAILAIKNG